LIRPTKYLDLNSCVLRVVAVILEELRKLPAISLNELESTVQSKAGENAKYNFLSALNFLYIIGKLDYDEESDAILNLGLKREQ
jgi:hypothetical protein